MSKEKKRQASEIQLGLYLTSLLTKMKYRVHKIRNLDTFNWMLAMIDPVVLLVELVVLVKEIFLGNVHFLLNRTVLKCKLLELKAQF